MATTDKCVTINPYFQVHEGKLEAFKSLCLRFVERSSQEPDCLYYGFSFDGNLVFCREGYRDADALLKHLTNVEDLKTELIKLADVVRVEVHGNDRELAKLHGPMAKMRPQFFALEFGFRR